MNKTIESSSNDKTERHPFKPFLSPNVKVMMFGSFPPACSKWRMKFYYPNFQNDMWRILGLTFFDKKEYFLNKDKKSFDENRLKAFLLEKGIGVADMGVEVIRLKNNASDKHLEIVKPLNVKKILPKIPFCKAFITTGEKATETLRMHISHKIKQPRVGEGESFVHLGRKFDFYRLPSSSRAYPMPLVKKAEVYKQCFEDIGLI